MATHPRTKPFSLIKFAICVIIGLALGIVFRDFDLFGVPAMAIGPAAGALVAHVWSKPDRAAAGQH